MSTNLTTADQLSSLASAVKGKLNVLDTLPATVNGGLWIEGGGSVPIIKLLYGDNTYKLTPELVPAPQTGGGDFTFTYSDEYHEPTEVIQNLLEEGLEQQDLLGALPPEIAESLQEISEIFTSTEAALTVELSGAVPAEPATVTYESSQIFQEGVTYYVILTADENFEDHAIFEATEGGNTQLTFELPVEFIAAHIDTIMTMIILQPVEE